MVRATNNEIKAEEKRSTIKERSPSMLTCPKNLPVRLSQLHPPPGFNFPPAPVQRPYSTDVLNVASPTTIVPANTIIADSSLPGTATVVSLSPPAAALAQQLYQFYHEVDIERVILRIAYRRIWRDYLRIRVKLQKKLEIQGGPICYVTFKYEDLPTFCFICGVLGHSEVLRKVISHAKRSNH
ncbi:hypothetical protein F8388_000215 [Cannabis sativa]|uniref:Zinc knuckle CX2CX4HX4C domain-containing protein n=1 Tax=Cannabis sativa TaxID=3483 RepID=A0A7J6F0P1_CANSA|nr:hypothetical protein F8388_000215 [Cannabis sativa]